VAAETRQYDDPYKVYEIAEGIYWVGFPDRHAGFSNNPYLVVTGDEAVLIDPGSVVHYHVVAKKVLQIVRAEQISTIIVQHQDPDLCASIPKFEALVVRPIRVVVPPRAALFMPYYGITSELVTPQDRERLTIEGRTFEFHYTPYVHFAQAMMTWDPASGSLFTSDVFAAITKHWRLIADTAYVEDMRAFIEPYVGSQRAWLYALDRVRAVQPRRLCPQHGSIVRDDINEFLDTLASFRVGRLLPDDPRAGVPV
jgi:flavorubredoxin